MNQVASLIDRYYSWLRDKTAWRAINKDWVEITTPYLDRHNDYIQLYLKQEGDKYVLTDDSHTITDLIQAGCSLDSPKRQKLLQMTINGFGVHLRGQALEVQATPANFALRKHNLLQAILAVNDLFYLASPTVASFFFEDVALWLDSHDIRYTERVKFAGRSGYDHMFDFVVPKSKRQPERILKAINNPNKDYAQATAFSWLDTREARSPEATAFAVLNDEGRQISPSVIEALQNYEITPMIWTRRDEMLDRLAA
ncbi:DUF1829 domain-containing protein [Desulfurivibrio sp. C05AmB]|uniref:DUF1829 domain-containing protein n=1 Tax=Desulfurivibrio sp. C05AmB TaxID=3374371 RepID=UPI00376EC01D